MEIKPKEMGTFKYWMHLIIIAFIVLLILQIWRGGEMLTIKNILLSMLLLLISDIIAHTLLGLD